MTTNTKKTGGKKNSFWYPFTGNNRLSLRFNTAA